MPVCYSEGLTGSSISFIKDFYGCVCEVYERLDGLLVNVSFSVFFPLVKGSIFRSSCMEMNPCSIYRHPVKIHVMKRKLGSE